MNLAIEAYDGGDLKTAITAWHRAAGLGNTKAMTFLANAYLTGEGTAPDATAAFRWYRRAAERGDMVGQLNLGDMLAEGTATERDPVSAYVWLGLAARQGNEWAAERQREVAANLSGADLSVAKQRFLAWRPRTL